MIRCIAVIVAVLLTNVQAWAQDITNNFSVDAKGLRWQKVFETGYTFEELAEQIKVSGILNEPEFADNKIFGDIRPTFPNYKGAGFRNMETPGYISEYYYEGFALIEFREGKYRVTLSDIQITTKYSDTTGRTTRLNLEDWAIKNWEYEMTDTFKRAASLILDHTLTIKFALKKESDQENW